MRRKVCAKCGTPQQWEIWPKCACGGEFIAPPPPEPSRPGGVQPSAAEVQRLAAERECWRRLYANAPWTSLLLLTAAAILSLIYKPPLTPVLLLFGIASVVGLFAARAGISRYPSLAISTWYFFIFPYLVVRDFYDLGRLAQFLAVLAWMAFGYMAPFCIWRRRALAEYKP